MITCLFKSIFVMYDLFLTKLHFRNHTGDKPSVIKLWKSLTRNLYMTYNAESNGWEGAEDHITTTGSS